MVIEKVMFEQAMWGWIRLLSLRAEEAKIRVFQQGRNIQRAGVVKGFS